MTALLALAVAVRVAAAAEISPPRNTTLAVYDSGFALVSELRVVTLGGAEDRVVIKPLPARLDPQTVSFEPVGGGKGFEVIEQRFEDDLSSVDRLFQRYQNRPVQVRTADGVQAGRLAGSSTSLQLIQPDGALRSFPSAAQAGEVVFPEAERNAYLEPTLLWQAKAAQEGPQNMRLSYLAYGLRWDSSYDLLLSEDGASARLAARVALHNESGGSFREARVKLVLTEQGLPPAPETTAPARPFDPTAQLSQRYAYGAREPQAERAVASLAPVETYEVPRPVTLGEGDTVHVQIAAVDRLPVTRFYVYDGVRFDRFQRNRRNDWNYGTEYHASIDTHLEFENSLQAGLGFALPPGRVNLYQRGEQELVDLLGSEVMRSVAAGGQGHVRLGPARGLRGERERTGYNEVKPLHEYEESFEIRLANDSDQTVVVRVVEHLYRWHEYEVVKSDLEYQSVGPQTIEFRPELKPGGRRTVHYTVRYRW
jgi:hypothetical protein